jgi:hydroxyacylglutathione hydrolase
MQIYRLPAFTDNYIFLLHDARTNTAVVVDPGDAAPVFKQLKLLNTQLNTKLIEIWNTHADGDHIGGNRELIAAFPDLVVCGSAIDKGKIPGQQVFLTAGDRVIFADRVADVLALPGHRSGHIGYYFPAVGDDVPELFAGDVLFSAGCGKVRESPADRGWASVAQLRALPDETRVWCAHEYTLANLKFARQVEPENPVLQAYFEQVKGMRDRGEPTVPTTIGHEKQINPFLRWDVAAVQEFTRFQVPAAVFGELRRLKEGMA